MFGNRTKSYSLKVFGKFDYRTNNYESVFSLLHPRRFLSRLSGEYTVFTEIYERRNATGVISLLAVVVEYLACDGLNIWPVMVEYLAWSMVEYLAWSMVEYLAWSMVEYLAWSMVTGP